METKPGYKTTEFWVTLLLNFANALNVSGVWNFAPNRFSVIAAAVSVAAYTVARGIAKAGVKPTPPLTPTTVTEPTPPSSPA